MPTAKTAVFWVVIVVSAFLLWQVVRSGGSAPADPEISYSAFLARIANGQVSKVTIAGSVVRGHDPKGASFRVIAPLNQSAMLDALQQHGVDIWFRESPEQGWPTWVLNLAPLVLLAALWFFMIRQMQKSNRLRATGQTSTPSSDSRPRFGP
ncbi:MAG: ATP-dependent metallopeptidase FtsH/Yme1/Tma family protein [Acidobacteriales bacterium]|nr:ATP-dependent metallopeptidase FtsH/Yme1/Tma family protein [Candidatus Koribacter versatilis]MBI3644987.1 ATP-dependent metallopeptidase FtsH/Yme1/Tma family protein [Terriglobales bacterium]